MLHPLAAALEVVQVDLGRAETLRQLEQRRELPVVDPADNRRDRQLDPGAHQVTGGGDDTVEAPRPVAKAVVHLRPVAVEREADAHETGVPQPRGGGLVEQPAVGVHRERETERGELLRHGEQVPAQQRLAAAEVGEQHAGLREAAAGLEHLVGRELVGLLEARIAMLAAEVAAVVQAPVHQQRRRVDLPRRAHAGTTQPRATRSARNSRDVPGEFVPLDLEAREQLLDDGAHVAGAVAELPDFAAEEVEFGDPPALDDEQRPLPARVAAGLEGGERIARRVLLLPPGEPRAAPVAFTQFHVPPSFLGSAGQSSTRPSGAHHGAAGRHGPDAGGS